ncbi:MAG: nickel pincer cofactor biosynthesis protein LarB [Chthoniobacterales bacterium]
MTDFVDLGHTRVDVAREARCGFPEVVFCESKTPEQVADIAMVLVEKNGLFLGTRTSREHFAAVAGRLPEAIYHELARCITWQKNTVEFHATVAVVCAGTSDLPVAEEARVTLEAFGNATKSFTDIGIAGLHRLLSVRDEIEACDVIIVVAGMEGALPSAVSGLTSKPVIAVPTSVGYGANFGGLAALLGMLNSCGSGVTVVNIDNGFGAAYAAASITRLLKRN